MAGAALAGWKSWGEPQYRPVLWAAIGLAIAAFWIGAFKTWRLRKKEKRYEPLNEPKDIASWAQSTFKALDERHDIQEKGARLTVYRIEYDSRRRDPVQLQQMIEYVGSSGGPAGRFVPARCGAVGVCARTGKAISAKRESNDLDDFRAEVVRQWGFTEHEARQVSVDRFSFFATPITESDGGYVVAVVFLDSRHPDLFESEEVQESILEFCGFLTDLIRSCYAS